MHRPSVILRFQLVVLLASVVLTLLYFLAYLPLARRVANLDQSLTSSWNQLVAINHKYKMKLGVDLDSVNESYLLSERAVGAMQIAAHRARNRIELDAETREKLGQPFQLLDFDQRRYQLIAEVRALADEKKVVLDPSVTAGYPELLAGRDKPSQLWAQLFIFDQILRTAVTAGPGAVKSFSLLPVITHPSMDTTLGVSEEFPVKVAMVGPMETILNFLLSLPLREDEQKKLNLPASSPNKPSLFIQKLVLKSILGNPNEASLEAVVSGFACRDLAPGSSETVSAP